MTSAIFEFPLAPAHSFPMGITTGPDDNLWFTKTTSGQIGEIVPTRNITLDYTIPTAKSGPFGITVGSDGNLWFTEALANKIGKINPTTHAISDYAIPTTNSLPGLIGAGPDGNLWFTEVYGNKIGRINPTTHAIAEYAVPTANSQPGQIIAGPDGNLWFTENNNNQIGELNLTTHHITEFATPTADSQPLGITVGPDGNLWFTENNDARIGSIDPKTHLITEYKTPTPNSEPVGITVGADGNLWFTEDVGNQIGELNLATHVVTETAIPTVNSSPGFITAGPVLRLDNGETLPRGTLWFTENDAGQIGEIRITALGVFVLKPYESVEVGQTAAFTASAIGTPTPTVQWQVSTPGSGTFTPLSNGGRYSGVNSSTLTVSNVTSAQNNNQYRAVFSNGNASATTTAATLNVRPVPSITLALAPGLVGVNYSQSIIVNGGIMPTVTVSNFNAGVTGFKASAITVHSFQFMPTVIPETITIKGTPTAAGTATFTVHLTDATGFTLTKTFSILVGSPARISSLTQTQWTVGKAGFTGTMTISGGMGPFHIASSSGWPTGLTAKVIGNVISFTGAPSVARSFASGSITIEDATRTSVTKTFSLIVNPPLQITTISLPIWTSGTPYMATLHTTGGTGTAIFAIASGKLPTGLTLSSNGHITGVSNATGSFTFTIIAFDVTGAMFTKTYTV